MNNKFEELKKETVELIEGSLVTNEKGVLKFINTILEKCNSKLNVRKNMSIQSFRYLLLNSASFEEFQTHLNKLDVNKDYAIYDLKTINEDIQYNEECKEDNIEDYEQYKKFRQ
jgi:hypothetical protein